MKQAEDNIKDKIYQRLVSEDGRIEMGIHPVVFGYRVRAGLVGDCWCQMDWCGGADQAQLELLYSIAKNILEHKNSFRGVPSHSEIKPFYNDTKFVDDINKLVTQPLEIIKLKPLREYCDKRDEEIRRMFNNEE
jgi:hypothetical protein